MINKSLICSAVRRAVAGKIRFQFFSSNQHEDVDRDEIEVVVNKMGTKFREKSNGDLELEVCKLCPKDNKMNMDNLWKLIVRPDGSYYCYRCAKGSTWASLQNHAQTIHESPSPLGHDVLGIAEAIESVKEAAHSSVTGKRQPKSKKAPEVATMILPDQSEAYSYPAALFPISTAPPSGKIVDAKSKNDMTTQQSIQPADPQAQEVLHYLNEERGLSDTILMRYGVSYSSCSAISKQLF